MEFFLVHLCDNGSQVLCHNCGVEAIIKLADVVVVEGEGLIVDGHLVDDSDGALVDWKSRESLR